MFKQIKPWSHASTSHLQSITGQLKETLIRGITAAVAIVRRGLVGLPTATSVELAKQHIDMAFHDLCKAFTRLFENGAITLLKSKVGSR